MGAPNRAESAVKRKITLHGQRHKKDPDESHWTHQDRAFDIKPYTVSLHRLGKTSDFVFVVVSLRQFHPDAVEDNIPLFRVLVRNEPRSVKLLMLMAIAPTGNVLVLRYAVTVRSHGTFGERSVRSAARSCVSGNSSARSGVLFFGCIQNTD